MYRISGMLIVFICFTAAGIKKTAELDRRIKFLKEFRCMFEDLRTEIALRGTVLPEAVKQTGNKYSNTCFIKWVEYMSVWGAETGFGKALCETRKKYCFEDNDLQVLKCITASLGRVDLDNQLRKLDSGITEADKYIAEIASKYCDKKRMYLGGYTLTGIFIILLLM